jgi:hypothetical protein
MTRLNTFKALIITLFVIVFSACLSAQNFNITGLITNAETNIPVEFANIGVENTYIGTASGLDGYFQIELSHALKDMTIRISAVGYKTKSYKVLNWINKDSVKIQLTPVNYGISEISVEAQSKIGYGVLKAASNLIVDNYLNHPYSYKCYFQTSDSQKGQQASVLGQSEFLMVDKTAYQSRSFTDAYQSRNYTIIENNTDKEINTFSNGMTLIDQVINCDIVRCPGNILSQESINDFTVNILGKDIIESDSVWVIEYLCKNPSIQNCGDPEAKKYKGKIWITLDKHAVLKNYCEVSRNNFFMHGNNFSNPNKNQDQLVDYKFETSYRLVDDKYVLNSIDYIQDSRDTSVKVYLKVIEVLAYDESVKHRQYFNNKQSQSGFWSEYKRPAK